MINNWEIKKILRIVIAILLAMLGSVGLDALGFDIPFLRQIIGFIYLTFIPGFLILRILKLPKIDIIETLLYSVGLSIASLMFIGLFINVLYPLIGISKPISVLPVLVTLTFVIFILCGIAYKRGDSEEEVQSRDNTIQWSDLLSPQAMLLFLLPVLSVLGTLIIYFYQSNIVLLILLSLIALIAILIAFGNFIPAKLYPLAILTISISLLWHYTLISFDMFGSDSYREYISQNEVLINSIWNTDQNSNLNAMLSITMLSPIYSLILKLDTSWIFKIVFPIFFSLVPVALFQAYRKQTNYKIAFFAAFFFMSFPVFTQLVVAAARQQIAELFLALSILLFIDKRISARKRSFFLIIFGFSIVVSHYGLSYIYMMYLLLAMLLLFILNGLSGASFKNFLLFPQKSKFSVTYVVLIIVFGLAWYMYVSAGSAFNSVTYIGNHIYNSLSELFSSEAKDPRIMQAFGLAPMRSNEIEWKVAQIFQQFTQIFIIIGSIELIVNWRKNKLNLDYAIMSLISIVILVISIILPYFSTYFEIGRIYHITLFFLAPFCILGGITFVQCLSRILKQIRMHTLQNLPTSFYLKIVAILVLVPYFLFTTGFVFELTGATPTSMPLSLYKADWTFFTTDEIYARTWLIKMTSTGAEIYSDNPAYELLAGKGTGLEFYRDIPINNSKLNKYSYIFLRRWNVLYDEIPAAGGTGPGAKHIKLELSPAGTNKIYDGKNARILIVR